MSKTSIVVEGLIVLTGSRLNLARDPPKAHECFILVNRTCSFKCDKVFQKSDSISSDNEYFLVLEHPLEPRYGVTLYNFKLLKYIDFQRNLN